MSERQLRMIDILPDGSLDTVSMEDVKELRSRIAALEAVVEKLEGPFDGTEGLDSFTLATVIGWFQAALPKNQPTP